MPVVSLVLNLPIGKIRIINGQIKSCSMFSQIIIAPVSSLIFKVSSLIKLISFSIFSWFIRVLFSIDSSDFNSLFQLSGVDLFNISTSKNIVLVNSLFVQNFGNGIQVWVNHVRKKFKGWSSLRFIEHFSTNKYVGSEGFEPEHNFVDDLSRFFISKFFEKNDFGIGFSIAWIEKRINSLLSLSDGENSSSNCWNIFASFLDFSG